MYSHERIIRKRETSPQLHTIQHTLLEYGGDLKAIALPVGTQLGFRKLCYFLCEWDSHAKERHFSLTLRLLMSYIYMELLVKPEMLTSYIYGPT